MTIHRSSLTGSVLVAVASVGKLSLRYSKFSLSTSVFNDLRRKHLHDDESEVDAMSFKTHNKLGYDAHYSSD